MEVSKGNEGNKNGKKNEEKEKGPKIISGTRKNTRRKSLRQRFPRLNSIMSRIYFNGDALII